MPEPDLRAVARLARERNKGQKFFLGVSFVKPHFPFPIQQKYYDMHQGRGSLPRISPKLLADLPALSKKRI